MPEDEARVRIIIIDDCSEYGALIDALAGTRPFISVMHRETHTDYSDVFRDMFRAAASSEWVWTFGDDDLLRPNALAFMLERLPQHSAHDFLHISEEKRASGTNNIYSASTFFDLANTFGWIEMSGFITGNIIRGALLAKAADTPRWKTYAKCAFVQSCALLEALIDRPCAFIDIPLITSQEMEQTEATMQEWKTQNISGRYLLVVDALEAMYDQGVMTKKVDRKFFRYLVYHLWDRFLTNFALDYLNHKALWSDEAWNRVSRFSQFLADQDEAKQLTADVDAMRGMCMLGLYMLRNVDGINDEVKAIFDRRNDAVYTYTFTPAATSVALPAAVPQEPT
jgi:hypothetical protein